ncbi:hypothetical protein Tco_1110199 [Tanacetum coccineum]|uniref:Transposase MuDR plant domain-containing protein n=1 Tax=Tanacetum coccineum TaxID=301880 RepID=A0ABQ5II50_9ASTR
MGGHIQEWYIRAQGESFDTVVYGDCPKSLFPYTYTNFFSIKCHYAKRFTDAPNKKYVEGYENEDEVLFYYKIPLKSLDIGLKPLVSKSDISSFLGYVNKHKIMYVYVELVENIEGTSDGDGDGDSKNDRESKDGNFSANDIVDEKHLVDEIEVNMKDDLEVLEFDSLKSDQEDVTENVRSRGLRNLRKKGTSSSIRNNFYVGKEFANKDLAKERIRAYSVKSRRNLDFKRNDKRRIRMICKCVVPTLTSKNEYVDCTQNPFPAKTSYYSPSLSLSTSSSAPQNKPITSLPPSTPLHKPTNPPWQSLGFLLVDGTKARLRAQIASLGEQDE